MSTIAIVPSDYESKRMLARRFARRLADAGHRVVFFLPADDHRRSEDTAFEQRVIALRTPAEAAGSPLRPLSRRRAVRRAAAAIDTNVLARALDDVGVDLVIVDIEEYEAVIALLSGRRHRTAVLCSFFEVWPIPGIGPDDPGPAGGAIDRVRATTAWWRLWAKMRVNEVRRELTGDQVDRIAVNRALAHRAGVRRRLTSRQWLRPFAPAELPMLVCNALELDVPHHPRPGVRHVGSLLEPVGSLAEGPLADGLEEAVAAGRPIVICVFGALLAAESSPLVDRIGEVADRRPGYEFVVGSANDDHAARLAGRPNVHVAGWLPQREVLALASAAIVHSGNATLHESVVARVPMLVYPFRYNDQPRNAARVVRHGIGEVGDRGDDAATIADRLDRVMHDPAIRRRIEELAPHLERYEHDRTAVTAVEELLALPGPHVTGDGRRTP